MSGLDPQRDEVASYCVDLSRRITSWSAEAEAMTGYGASSVKGRSCAENLLVHVDESGRCLCQGLCPLAATMSDGQPREARVYMKHHDGQRLPVLVRTEPIKDDHGRIVGGREYFRLACGDGQTNPVFEQLYDAGLTDPVTGLSTWRYMSLLIEPLMGGSVSVNRPLGVVLMDIDFPSRDGEFLVEEPIRVTQAVAATLKADRQSDQAIGVLSSGQFAALLLLDSRDELLGHLERWRAITSQCKVPVVEDGGTATLSIGATTVESDERREDVLERADRALTAAKQSGGNCVRVEWPGEGASAEAA